MKKIFKKLLLVGIAVIMVMPCQARGLINIYYNEQEVYLEQESKLIDDTVLLPLRALSQQLGYSVNWDQEARQIDVINGNAKVTLFMESDKALVNGEEVKLSVPAQRIGGTTYVPLRFVGEALDLEVAWDSSTQSVNLEGKYTVDRDNKKLMVRTKDKKQVLADIKTLEGAEDQIPSVSSIITKNGSEIVSVSEVIQGALTGTTCTNFYIKDGKVIDKIERPFHYIAENGIAYLEDKIAFGYGRYLRIYNDKTGELIKQYDLNAFQEGLTLDLMKLGKNYAMGRYENTIHIIDFETGKVTRILDLIPKEDQGYVFESDMHLATDKLKLVWETEDALVFKYYSITEGIDKTVTCRLGE